MSKLGFDRILSKLSRAEKRFLQDGMRIAKREFKQNFDKEQNSETGNSWDMVVRAYPPPILEETTRLRRETLYGEVIYSVGKASLIIDPVDKRGRGYASYHEEGTDIMPQREFVTQSENSTNLQIEALYKRLDEIF